MTHPQPQEISILDSVPDEILKEIFTHIVMGSPFREEYDSPEYISHPLLPVVQVNRRFNAIASPLMVRKWRLRFTDQSIASDAGFVLHLLKQPHLRSQIRSLALNVLDFDAEWFDDSHIPTVEVQQLVESAERACPPLTGMRYQHGRVSWLSDIGSRSPGAICALVVIWATELQELDLTLDNTGNIDEWEPDPWLIRLVKLTAEMLSPRWGQDPDLPPPAMFMKLRCVTLRHYDGESTLEGTRAASFFRLPGLRVFKAYFLDAQGLTLDEADQSATGTALQPSADKLFPKGTSSVEEIHLYRSHISENGLGVLTRACKYLRVLVLQWSQTFVPGRGFSFFGNAILEVLKLHFASLEEIMIDGTDYTLVNSYGDVDSGVFGDWLLRCDKLQRLTIDLEVLYGDENYQNNSSSYPLSLVLPAGLTSLSLTSLCLGHGTMSQGPDIQATKNNILGLLRQCGQKGRLSRLKEIQITGYITNADEKQDLMILAKKAGVGLTLRERVVTDQSLTTASVGYP